MLLLLAAGSLKAQLVHVKGEQLVVLSGGIVERGFNIKTSYQYQVNDWLIARGRLGYETKTFKYNNLKQFMFEPEGLIPLVNAFNGMFVHAKAGLMVGREASESEVFGKYSATILGQQLGINCVYYFSKKLSAHAEVEQRFIQRSESGKYGFSLSLGFGYKF